MARPFNFDRYAAWARTPKGGISPGDALKSLKAGNRNRPKYVICENCYRPIKNGTKLNRHRKECHGPTAG